MAMSWMLLVAEQSGKLTLRLPSPHPGGTTRDATQRSETMEPSLLFKGCRAVFFVCNTLAILMGLTMMGSGIYMYANEARDYFNVLPPELEKMKHLRTVIIMSGVCTCFVATFGLCGVLQESQTTLMTYLIMTLALFIINMVVGSFALIFRGTMEENLGHMLGDSLKNERHWKSWFKLQAKLKCCGVNGYTDWREIRKDDTLPVSCCWLVVGTCRISQDHVHKEGCLYQITESLKGSIVTMGVVGCSLLVLQFLLLVATLIILVHLRKKASPGSESTTPSPQALPRPRNPPRPNSPRALHLTQCRSPRPDSPPPPNPQPPSPGHLISRGRAQQRRDVGKEPPSPPQSPPPPRSYSQGSLPVPDAAPPPSNGHEKGSRKYSNSQIAVRVLPPMPSELLTSAPSSKI
ncbi:hypothetical protein BaRGS_00019980 [Batillaria attramentaria]|uniref:Tetraspanin n=1 Tax=Batillaria attramentaria TaxID=370345 RepID=A0ABD0KPW0_9CAEN